MPGHSTIFAFEEDFAGALYCVPMCVRLKLDCAGVKVSLAQWSRLPLAVRDQLVVMPCEDADSTGAYRETIVGAVESATGDTARFLTVEQHPEWMDGERIPAQLVQHCRQFGPMADQPSITLAQWAGLTPLQRFTLIKLSRPGHSNENFLPALREFGLLPG